MSVFFDDERRRLWLARHLLTKVGWFPGAGPDFASESNRLALIALMYKYVCVGKDWVEFLGACCSSLDQLIRRSSCMACIARPDADLVFFRSKGKSLDEEVLVLTISGTDTFGQFFVRGSSNPNKPINALKKN
jgi:hypothetical protein